ncbi:palmitoyltransferase swf1 [Phytophthora boehmeriae]|uniref:Palmitoyltransferase swf1 n=1 Tax=Phytophthora boehmeriae TaxID=109152 RepID=A0A8T1WPJ1_9STRA|nr:palmitoyltransferase swf1 [Phytophthora boehmeriae]
MGGAIVRLRDYVFFERNPLVQILYFAAMGACYYLYLREAHPQLPNEYVDWYHKWLATLLFVVSIALYLVMCWSDPGIIRRDNMHEFKQYVGHPVLYPDGKYCHFRGRNTVGCAIIVLADSITSTCLAQLAVCLEGFYLTSSVFLVQTEDYLHSSYGANMSQVDRTERAKILQSLISSNQALGFVTAMCLMTSVILWVFIFMQLRRISQNTTANESFKREDLREEAEIDGETSGRRMFRFLFKRLNFRKRPKLAIPRREQKKALDASWGGLFSPDTIMNTEESFSVDDVNYNPYKLATFRENLLDALQLRGNTKQKTK